MRSFIGFGQAAYIGTPGSRAIKVFGLAGQCVPLLFQWLSYGASTAVPNINVLVNLDTAPCKGVDQIRSVYIDNLGSPNPVYVYFPDTQYTLAAKANSEGWYPAFTNAKQFWVVGEGFLDGNIPQTSLLISNVYLPPSVNTEIDQSVNLYRASPVITRGNSIYNNSLGIPALGDQLYTSPNISFQVPGSANGLWGTPFPSGFVYVTSMIVYGSGFQPIAGDQPTAFNIESLGVAGLLVRITFDIVGTSFSPSAVPVGNVELLRMEGLQLKLDATQTWRIRSTNSTNSGSAFLLSAFTQQP